MTSQTTAVTPILSRAGILPPLPGNVGQTFALQKAVAAFRIMDAELDITCFDGPAGTGKTTACSYAAAESRRTWRYCILPLRTNPKNLTAKVYEAVFQRSARGTERQMTNMLVDRLCEGGIGLIADEIHHVGLAGAQQLRYLWDQAARQSAPFPMLLVGATYGANWRRPTKSAVASPGGSPLTSSPISKTSRRSPLRNTLASPRPSLP